MVYSHMNMRRHLMPSARFASFFFVTVLIGMGQSNGILTITTPAPLLPAALGLPYSQSLSATGGNPPYTWSLLSGDLPSGLVLSPSGVITGTPESTGASSFAIKVTDSASGSATQTYGIIVISVGALSRFGTLSHIAAGGW